VPPFFADDLLRRPLLFGQFFDHFPADTFRKPALETVTFLSFIGIFLSQMSGITPFVAVTLKFPTDNEFVFPNKFGYLFLSFACPEQYFHFVSFLYNSSTVSVVYVSLVQ
jgi:hypothetical protein